MSVFQFRGPLSIGSPLYKGRQIDLNKLLRWCQGEVQHYGIIYGARQSGKSSLLLRLEQQLYSTHAVCHADFEYLTEATPARVFGALAQVFARAFEQPLPDAEIPDALRFSEYLYQLLDLYPAQRVVLLIEELGALPLPGRFALANALRAMFNERQRSSRRAFARLMVIVAGNTELYDLAYTDVSPFSNICETHYLVDLNAAESVSLIQDGLTTLGVPADQGAAYGQSIYQLAHGYPYLTQRLGHALETALEDGEKLNDTLLEKAAEDLITCGDPIVTHLQKVLLEQNLFPAAKTVLTETLRFNRHDEALARLELAGLIRPEDGYWRVRNPLYHRAVRTWLDSAEESTLIALQKGLVRIFNLHNIPVGAGFLIEGGGILTCAHVITDALGLPRGTIPSQGEVLLDFPLICPNEKMTAQIINIQVYTSGKVDDIALLELVAAPPPGTGPLAFANKPGKDFRVCGFPKGREDGAWASGQIIAGVSGGLIQLESTKSTGYPILLGFSGSPVWCESAGGVIGMIVAADTDREVKVGHMIPVSELLKFLKS